MLVKGKYTAFPYDPHPSGPVLKHRTHNFLFRTYNWFMPNLIFLKTAC